MAVKNVSGVPEIWEDPVTHECFILAVPYGHTLSETVLQCLVRVPVERHVSGNREEAPNPEEDRKVGSFVVEQLKQIHGQEAIPYSPHPATPTPQSTLPSAVASLAFGAAQWNKYFGVDVGVEPPLPPDVEAFLNGSCPLFAGKWARNTHMPMLIPGQANGIPFSIDLLNGLVRSSQNGRTSTGLDRKRSWELALQEHGPKAAPAAHWVVMTKAVFPGSTNKTYADQCELLDRSGYAVATLLEGITCVLLECVRTGQRLHDRGVWRRVQEQTDGSRLTFGALGSDGLRIHSSLDNDAGDSIGVSALRRF